MMKQIDSYTHTDKKRANNPPVGLVTAKTDKDLAKKRYAYDVHLDPTLQWSGKAEHMSFEVPTVSLHVHERIDPKTIIECVKKRDQSMSQPSLFFQKQPIREAIEFYQHKNGWANRLIAGDSLLVMNSLLQKEGMDSQVQMVYIDPPYGISYGSNFQPFVNKKEVKDGKDEDLTSEPEMICAFRDTWELGIHSYLTYMRDRLLLARELLNDSGSCFVQISDENLHHIRELMDEVLGAENFVTLIPFRKKTGPIGAKYLECVHDFLLWYAKDRKCLKYRQLYIQHSVEGDSGWNWVQLVDGSRRKMTKEEINNHRLLPKGAKIFQLVSLKPTDFHGEKYVYPVEFCGKTYFPPKGSCWVTRSEGMQKLLEANRIEATEGSTLYYVYFLDDFGSKELVSFWNDTAGAKNKAYVVQTTEKVLERCILMSTDPGDLVLDPTCGSGTTATVAEHFGRRWITCDTSRIAISIAKQRFVTRTFPYFALARESEGVAGGFQYETQQKISRGSIIQEEPAIAITFYDQPKKDNRKVRVTGPFTVEAVPAPVVQPIDEAARIGGGGGDASIARTPATIRQYDWQEELLKTGIRGKSGQRIEFSYIDPLSGCYFLHADAKTKSENPERVVIAFGPDCAPLEQRQVEMAIEEARQLVPNPKIIVFAAFQFDPEATKDIDEMRWPGVTLLKAQMSPDLLIEDLKKKRASNESFWLIGQPDVEKIQDENGKWQIEIKGFDYFDIKTGKINSGNAGDIAMWMLDTDYDGCSIFPRQLFFPMAGENEGWAKLTKNIKAEIDEDLIQYYRGTCSLPFESGQYQRAAVKIIDNRGIESLKIINF